MKVKIAFKEEFREVMLNGDKTFTSRTKKMGTYNDTFEIFGATFRIKDVSRMTLNTVAHAFYKEEGCKLPDDFITIWQKIHPRKGFVPEQWVFVHEFERIR